MWVARCSFLRAPGAARPGSSPTAWPTWSPARGAALPHPGRDVHQQGRRGDARPTRPPLGEEVGKDLWVGTFHATCAKLLRRFGESVGLERNFVIYDTDDQKAVVVRALREIDLDEKRYPPRIVLSRIHKEKQECRGPEDCVDSDVDDAS